MIKQSAHTGSLGILVRLASFVVMIAAAFAIPAAIATTTFGHVAHGEAAVVVVAAIALIAGAAMITRPFDPLRS